MLDGYLFQGVDFFFVVIHLLFQIFVALPPIGLQVSHRGVQFGDGGMESEEWGHYGDDRHKEAKHGHYRRVVHLHHPTNFVIVFGPADPSTASPAFF